MRYYNFVLNTNSDEIKEKATIKLSVYEYGNTINSMNNYIHRNIDNHLTFFAYREEGNCLYAAFSYDERMNTFQATYEYILGLLKDCFRIRKIKMDPCEITMFQYMECLSEAQRRDYGCYSNKLNKTANLWLNNYAGETTYLYYDFKEFIIPEGNNKENPIYDQSFITELRNIEKHRSVGNELKGNMVHYIVSGRSNEATRDMTETLLQSLFNAGRISSRRYEMITEIEPEFFCKNNHLETIIENNCGGTIVFNLSEKFGIDPVDYVKASKYIENLLKKYRNHCLFIFTYNIDHPGFSYQLLPKLNKYVIPVMLREGSGDRKTAVKYMKDLIKKSEYAKYAGQANEFMKLFPGDTFSQTDVIMAYEKFESWCVNKNILHAYNYDSGKGFMMDRDENADSSYDRLQKLIGLDIVKKQIDSIISTDIIEKERKKHRGKDYQSGSMHMIFAGNPGSAKTTVAKLFAGIAKEKGILKSGAFVERGGMDLDGIGCVTAIREAFLAAKGGVLFIDEAYSMTSNTAVTVLIQEMENRRDEVICILAGYDERMKEFLKINEGLKSRIPHWIEFPDYTVDELTDIFKFMIDDRGFTATDDAVEEARYIFEKVRNVDNFGNGRYVRNLIDRATQNQAVRLLPEGEDAENIRKKELFLITKDDICMLEEGLKKERTSGTAKKELDGLIGLSSVKKVIRKAIANYKLNKMCIDRGIAKERASMHMVFTGNPGTAKTTVARLFAEILKDEKVLSTGVFVETGRAELVGDHVGSTAKIVKQKFKEAQGGVLFIDEAYALNDGCQGGYGDEAINTLVQEMENNRDKVIVIFAGYPDPMKEFLDRNPGMLSRIAFQVEFEDYSTEELCDITKLMVSNKQMKITDAALDKLMEIYESVCGEEDYGNGRFVRKTLEEAEMNLAERVMEFGESEITTELITTIEECDIPELSREKHKITQIGFACKAAC